MLLRTRPVASSPYFWIHVKNVAEDDAPHLRGRLIVTAPKRVLRRAVERNAIRRVAREAWRAAALHQGPAVALLRVRKAIAAPGTGLPARKRAARDELDRLFAATNAVLRKRACTAPGTEVNPAQGRVK